MSRPFRLSRDPKGYGTRMTDKIAIEDEGEFGIAEAWRAAQLRRSDSWSTAPWCTAST
jgi:hypothetical protein